MFDIDILGPVAVRYSSKANEPLADIMNGIHDGWIDIMKETISTTTPRTIKQVEYIGGYQSFASFNKNLPIFNRISVTVEESLETDKDNNNNKKNNNTVVIRIPETIDEKQLPEGDQWRSFLIHCYQFNSQQQQQEEKNQLQLPQPQQGSFWTALLTASHIVQNKKWTTNLAKQLFDPRPGKSFIYSIFQSFVYYRE